MKYLNLKQLSEKIGGRSRTSIYRDVNAGRLPEPIKLGTTLLWREEEVEALIEGSNAKSVDME